MTQSSMEHSGDIESRQLVVSVPDDIDVVRVDDIEEVQVLRGALTTSTYSISCRLYRSDVVELGLAVDEILDWPPADNFIMDRCVIVADYTDVDIKFKM